MKAITFTAIAAVLFSSSLFAAPVNINAASAEEIAMALDGIGQRKAMAVVSYREQNGPFQNPQDITLVKGIGSATFEQNKVDILVK